MRILKVQTLPQFKFIEWGFIGLFPDINVVTLVASCQLSAN